LHDEREAKKALEDLLLSAVQYQLISDVPLGVFLSGGIDSSTVAALASRLLNTRLNTFSIGFTEAKFNEAPYASAVAKHLGTQHHEFIVSAAEAKRLVEPMLDAYDEPYADSSAIPTMLVSQLARQHVTVALCGDGGDELFFGYGMYQWAERLANPWLKVLRKPVSRLLTIPGAPRYRKAASLFGYEDESGLHGHIFSQEQGFFAQTELRSLLAAGTMPEGRPGHRGLMRELTPREKQALYDLETYLPDDLLTKVDRATMRYGLEARVPLLDHRVVEFALNLAPNLKYRNGVSKYLLKEVLYQYIPRHLFDRPKRGFSVPLASWLQGDLRYLQEEYLRKEVVERYGVTRFETVKELLRQFNGGNAYVYHRVWLLIVLHYWLQKHA
jgi:asparagine synthase (glutamine-hydrolysing)